MGGGGGKCLLGPRVEKQCYNLHELYPWSFDLKKPVTVVNKIRKHRSTIEVPSKYSNDTLTAILHSEKIGNHTPSRPNTARIIHLGTFAVIPADSN